MNGSPAVLTTLNSLLADELAAYNQYLAHAAAAENLGYSALAKLILDRAEDEARHARLLIDRILVLGGSPNVATIGTVDTDCRSVPVAVDLDTAAEVRAVNNYNSAVEVARVAGDNTTRQILEAILGEEDNQHLNELEGWQIEIADLGLASFLLLRSPKEG